MMILTRSSLHWKLGCNRVHRLTLWAWLGLVVSCWPCRQLIAQQPLQTYTWQQLRDKFEEANPTLRAEKLNIDESREQEVTAFLRPNPDLTLSTDGTQLNPYHGVYQPLAGTQYGPSISYLHEREHK